ASLWAWPFDATGANGPSDRRAISTAIIVSSLLRFANFEFLRVDLRVDLEAIERRLLDGVGSDGAAQSKWELHPVDVAVVGEIETVFHRRGRRATLSGRRRTSLARGRGASLAGRRARRP